MKARIEELVGRLPQLQTVAGDIEAAAEVLKGSLAGGGKVLLCGNGGSAADCEHISGEMLKGFCSNRSLSSDDKAKLPEGLAESLQGGLPAVAIPSMVSINTAFGNDVSAEVAFAQCVWALGNAGDVLFAISTSGNAENVRNAAAAAKGKAMATVGLTGESGGKLAPLCDVCIKVPEIETHLVQELHLPVYHCLCLILEDEFFG